MRKTFLTFALLLAVVAMNAQTLIKASLKQGDKAVYENMTDFSIAAPMGAGEGSLKTSSKLSIEVKEANTEGYKVEFIFTDPKIEGESELLEQTGDIISQYLMSVPLLYQTDKNGAVTKLINANEVIAKASKVAIDYIENLYKQNPGLDKQTSKAKMIMGVSELLTEKNITDGFKQSSGWGLYGKTLKTGDKEKENFHGLKSIITYELSNILGTLAVVGKSKSDMSETDVKAFLIDNMKKMGVGEEGVAQIEQHWDQMKAMGMTNMDFTRTTTYHFAQNGWLNDNATDSQNKMMGANVVVKTNLKMIEHNWK